MNKHKLRSSTLSSQQGTAIIEFLLTAVPILLLSLGATETARWYMQKQHIRYALLEAQRVASVSHAKPELMIEAFEEALKPLFAPAGQHRNIEARRDAYLTQVSQKTGTTPWRISILSPTAQHFKDFSQSDLEIARTSGFAAINNNYQSEQHQEKGLGPHSQESIYEANILSINLIYPYKPLVPGVSNLMKLLSSSTSSKLKQSYYDAGYLAMELSSHIGMQSHPVQWPSSPNSKVMWHDQIAESEKLITIDSKNSMSINTCSGIWCPKSTNQRASTVKSDFPMSSDDIYSSQAPQSDVASDDGSTLNNAADEAWSTDEPSSSKLDDPLCGTSLCCG